MGGIGFSIGIERTSADAIPLPELHEKVWEHMAKAFGLLRKPGNQVTTGEYLWDSAHDGLQGEPRLRWAHDESSLGIWFRDAGGCCGMSCEASLHWVRIVFARTWKFVAVPGWRILAPERPLQAELALGPIYPLVYLRRGMRALVRRRAGAALEGEAGFGDDILLDWAELKAKESDTVEWTSLTGECQCDLCVGYRKEWLPPKERCKPADHLAAARAAWQALETGDHGDQEVAVAAELKAWDWTERSGPPSLQALARAIGAAETMPVRVLAGIVTSRRR